MPTLYDFYKMSLQEKKKWETLHSSLIRSGDVTYEQCRAYSCKNITDGFTKVAIKKGEIIEIPQGVPFHFIGRVDTSMGNNSPKNITNHLCRENSYPTLLFVTKMCHIIKEMYFFFTTFVQKI